MKGVIFNIVDSFIIDNLGKEKLDAVKKEAKIEEERFEAFTDYPDGHVTKYVTAATKLTGMDPEKIVFDLGVYALPKLKEIYPIFFKPTYTAKQFLMTVDDVIHTFVMKNIKGAKPPRFFYENPSPDTLVMKYSSERGLCTFFRGLIEGVAREYSETIEAQHTKCTKEGKDDCEFILKFSEKS